MEGYTGGRQQYKKEPEHLGNLVPVTDMLTRQNNLLSFKPLDLCGSDFYL